MRTVKFADQETDIELKINCGVGANYVGFEIDGKIVILTRAQIINDVLPLLSKVR